MASRVCYLTAEMLRFNVEQVMEESPEGKLPAEIVENLRKKARNDHEFHRIGLNLDGSGEAMFPYKHFGGTWQNPTDPNDKAKRASASEKVIRV